MPYFVAFFVLPGAPCEQNLFYLFPSYTEKIGSAQI